MHFSTIFKTLAPLLALAATVAANGTGNCKCSDSNGQNNEATEFCCNRQGWSAKYHGDQHHQCSSFSNELNPNEFKICCKYFYNVGDVFCWN
ncbi:hypothetical protein DL98DRAFT_599568 [Cadophora sp. DSE1049]|nr:hypothetical protein DL98DRAFT_599568 [Cadophora sp. DSE1049]